jgi:uncharacterized protein YjbI with pentapeptide repeats
LLSRYANGEREFISLNFDNVDFSHADLDGIIFRRCFLTANFRGASLRNAVFDECNLKTADSRKADLRGACFKDSAVCGISLNEANIEGTSFEGADYYGHILQKGEVPPDT